VVMTDLIEALQILLKYGNPEAPTFFGDNYGLCITPEISPSNVTEEDKAKLEKLSFFVTTDCGYELFCSHKFASC
jgi:hypothetical protein